jgi:glycosyltransferase involved in cell wall biosynthesis
VPPLRVHVVSHSFPDEFGDGGQQRVHALFAALADVSDVTTSRTVMLWPSDAVPLVARKPGLLRDVVVAAEDECDYVWWLHEYFLGIRVADSWEGAARLAADLATTDVVVVDHLWAWPLVRRAIVETGWAGKLIYHAHNAEHAAREAALRMLDIADTVSRSDLDTIGRMETALCQQADLIVACTDADARVFAAMGAHQQIVVPNGGNSRPSAMGRVNNEFLYVASNWYPNLVGFERLVCPALERLDEPVKIRIAGGAGQALSPILDRSRHRWTARHEVSVVGRLSDADLAIAYSQSLAVLVPIEMGTGSCIKTAEALANGLPAVCTTHGARGYEQFIADLGPASWLTADTPDGWADAFQTCISNGTARYAPRDELTWAAIVSLLADSLQAVMEPW